MMDQGIIPAVKHFPGHGDTAVDSHVGLPVVDKSPEELEETERWERELVALMKEEEAQQDRT